MTPRVFLAFLWAVPCFWASPSLADASNQALTLESVLLMALSKNPELASARDEHEAERTAIISRYWPDSPSLEFMRENNTNEMTREMGPMNWWGLTQELQFPLKYAYGGAAQAQAASSAKERARLKAHQLREAVISSYYEVFAMSRIVSLLEAQRETLREIARIAESRRGAGLAPQQDEMKAHVEQTKIEAEIILSSQELESGKAELNALLNRSPLEPVSLPPEELPAPKLLVKAGELDGLLASSSSMVLEKRHRVEQAKHETTLARLSYLPDAMLGYRKPLSPAPADAFVFSVEFKIPLWFFAHESRQNMAASANLSRSENDLEWTTRRTSAQAAALHAKTSASEKILKIYQTSLIPQATASLNSSRAAYQAGRAGFVDLLDGERSLYEVRIGYYRMLVAHTKNLVALETMIGNRASDLLFPESARSPQ